MTRKFLITGAFTFILAAFSPLTARSNLPPVPQEKPVATMMARDIARVAVAGKPKQKIQKFAQCRGASLLPETQSGIASWYGPRFHGRTTSNGEKYNMYDLTAAHRTLPMNTMVEVTNPRTNESVLLRINDRGPYIKGRVIDLSLAAADALGIRERGISKVEIRVVCKPSKAA